MPSMTADQKQKETAFSIANCCQIGIQQIVVEIANGDNLQSEMLFLAALIRVCQ